ncbi:MAG: tRNA threonylcarbamoyladenosine biosynthesis protein TsaE, partial [Candidatus Azotimanducaceae bacterium]
MSWRLNTAAATEQFGGRLVEVLEGSGIIFLKGDLGAGKTTLCRGMLRALGYAGAVKSPTFTLVEPYELPGHQVYHFDLYRLGDPDELNYLGVDEYF